MNSQLLGSFNAHNLLATLAVLLKEGFSLKQAVLAAEKVTPVPGRMEMVRAPNKPTGLVDYAHTPDALEKALMSLRPHLTGKLWCVFGCGGDRDRGKRPLMGKIAEGLADRVVLTNDNPRSEDPQAIMQEILAGMQQPSEVEVIADRKAAILFALNKAAVQDWILIAGKGHEDTQIIGNKIFPFNDLALLKDWMEERL